MIRWLYQMLLLCPHVRTTYPFTSREGERRMYVVCLECGKQLPYSWEEMKVIRPRLFRKPAAPSAPADTIAGQ